MNINLPTCRVLTVRYIPWTVSGSHRERGGVQIMPLVYDTCYTQQTNAFVVSPYRVKSDQIVLY